MLKAAILYKEEIESKMKEYFYTNEMLFYVGEPDDCLPTIADNSNGRTYFQYAVVNNDEKLIGFISYKVDYYSSCTYNFGAFSFDKGNPIMGSELNNLMEKLITKFHRVDFRAISGNPATRGYDAFLKKHLNAGRKLVLKDDFRDADGNYHDVYIYEFINLSSAIA